MKFCENLQKLRKKHGLSQEQLAEELGVTRQSISKWESALSYPEMDKLVQLCKIFHCSMDELINQDITKVETNNKNTFYDFFETVKEYFQKTIQLFAHMSLKDGIKFVLQLCIILGIIVFCYLPFHIVSGVGSSLLENIFQYGRFATIVETIWALLIHAFYFVLALLSFLYIFKIKWLEEKEIEEPIEEEKEASSIKKEVRSKRETKKIGSSFSLLDFFTKIILYFFKFMAMILLFFLLVGLLFGTIGLMFLLLNAFQGNRVYGMILAVIGGLFGLFIIAKVTFSFLFNLAIVWKKVFLSFIGSIVVLGFGIGITAYQFQGIKYIDTVPPGYEIKTMEKEIPMKEGLVLSDGYSGFYHIRYEIDNSLENVMKIKANYYEEYTHPTVLMMGNYLCLYENSNQSSFHSFFDFSDRFFQDFSSKTFYNYEKLQEVEYTITISETNLEKLQANRIADREDELIDSYQSRIDELEETLEKKEEELDLLKEKNLELEDQLTSIKDQLR